MNFSLTWINVAFIPSFVILPLSDPISFIECLKIAGVFVVGLAVMVLFNVYMIKVLKIFFNQVEDKVHSDNDDGVELEVIPSRNETFTSTREDLTTIDLDSLRPTREITPPPSVPENPFEFESSSVVQPEPIYHKPQHVDTYPGQSNLDQKSTHQTSIVSIESQEPTPKKELSPITVFISKYIDWILFGLMFICSLPFYYIPSIHTYLPYHLSITVLAYYIALLIPQKYPPAKKFAHPIIISTALILFVCFIGSLIYHRSPSGFLSDLKFYKTGKNYLNLFSGLTLNNNSKSSSVPSNNPTSTPQFPGCGDFLSSLMDVSIVALSLPMFSHRHDFIKNSAILVPTILASIGLCFFLYPIICHAIGIASERSIGFIGRSVTLALGTPLIASLGGSIALMSVSTILSGILGVLINEPLFKLLRVDKRDYVTRGVTLGINCGAIATAHLLNSDPRAASMSSLSFSVFGTLMVIMASIGAIRDLVRSLVGL
ncbi:hypothetical protein G210_2603 [Candida maltosa Xu316]|uniref:Uncharacterized protein n=1 Tax=Candida maltosa (strain Xu316) TaxID=1245528 RepID=M3J527_CANMX|nr:hypothetical protein G210_2603 [Candida maltosa Xu316]